MLLGQNGPGGSAGFLMFFAVIYSGVSNSKWDKLFVLLFVLISSFILIISYSKLGIIMGLLGVLSYLLFQFRFRGVLINAKKLGYVFFFFLSLFIWSKSTKSGSLLLEGASTFLSYKFGEDGSEYIDSGDKERLYYYFAVGEVFIQNPIFGVGYNGFYNAILETNTHRSGEMSEEEGSKNANPHNAFLYYISANGLIGWIITIVVFMISLSIYFKYFVFYRGVGVLIVFFISGIFIIHTNTLISFFNTPIMYIPTAIVCALVELRRTNYNMCSLDFQQDKIIK
jgi:O-antigen ligase